MNDSIRIERREKKVEVNDNGDYIVLPFGDQAFIPKMLELLREFDERGTEQQARAAEIAEMPDDIEKVDAAASLNLELCTKMAERVNGLFGADACSKIFGAGTPSIFAFADFFDQLAPIIRKYADEESKVHQERIKKYSAKYKNIS